MKQGKKSSNVRSKMKRVISEKKNFDAQNRHDILAYKDFAQAHRYRKIFRYDLKVFFSSI